MVAKKTLFASYRPLLWTERLIYRYHYRTSNTTGCSSILIRRGIGRYFSDCGSTCDQSVNLHKTSSDNKVYVQQISHIISTYTSREQVQAMSTLQNPDFTGKGGIYRGVHYVSYFVSKQGLWVLVRVAST